MLIFLNSSVDLQIKVDDGISKGRKHKMVSGNFTFRFLKPGHENNPDLPKIC